MANQRVDVKVVLLGKEFGGKTSLVTRFLHDRFDDLAYHNTIGAAFGAKRIYIHQKPLMLGVWDTAGSERYEAMSRIYYRGARAAILCYDLTDKSSYQRIQYWVSELQKNEENCRLYLCGTKYDLIENNASVRDVDYHTTTDYADSIRAQLFETSSKTRYNICELFYKIAHDFVDDERLRRPASPTKSSEQKGVDVRTLVKKKSRCGCS